MEKMFTCGSVDPNSILYSCATQEVLCQELVHQNQILFIQIPEKLICWYRNNNCACRRRGDTLIMHSRI